MTTFIGLFVFFVTLVLSIILFDTIVNPDSYDDEGKGMSSKGLFTIIVAFLWTFLFYWYN